MLIIECNILLENFNENLTLYIHAQSPDEDDDVVHCSCFVLCDDEDCVLLSVMKC